MSLRTGVQLQGMVRKTRCNQEWGTCNGKDKLDRLKQSIITLAKVNKTKSSLPWVSLCPHCPARAAMCFRAHWHTAAWADWKVLVLCRVMWVWAQATAGARQAQAAAQLPPPLCALQRTTNRALLFFVLQHNVGPILQTCPQWWSKPDPFFPVFQDFFQHGLCSALEMDRVCPLWGQTATCSLLLLSLMTLRPNPNPQMQPSVCIIHHPSLLLQRHGMRWGILSLALDLQASIQNTCLKDALGLCSCLLQCWDLWLHSCIIFTSQLKQQPVWVLQTHLSARLGILTVATKIGEPGNWLCKLNLLGCHWHWFFSICLHSGISFRDIISHLISLQGPWKWSCQA